MESIKLDITKAAQFLTPGAIEAYVHKLQPRKKH